MTSSPLGQTELMGAAVAPAAPDAIHLRTLLALALCTLLPALGTSIANVALPTLAETFHAPFPAVQWVVVAYLLAVTSAIVGAGRIGDLWGRGRVLRGGLVLYTVASAAAGLASGLTPLIVARGAQGVGAAVMMSIGMALVGDVVPKAKLGRAMGVLGTTSAVGTALGPTVGGLLLAGPGWRAIFLVHAPLALLALALVHHHLPSGPPRASATRARFDVVGTAVLVSTLTAYALGVTVAPGQLGGASVALVAAAAAGVVLFLVVEARAVAPLVQPTMLRDPVLAQGLASSTMVATVVMTTMVVGPFHLSRGLGLAPRDVGLAMSVGPMVAALTGVPAGRLVDRLGSRAATLGGLAAMVVGTALVASAPLSLHVAGYVLPIAVTTSGYALFQTSNNTSVMRGVADTDRGVVSAMLNLSRNLGLITGASVMGSVFASVAGGSDLVTADAAQVVHAMRVTFGVASAVVGLAWLLFFPRDIGASLKRLLWVGLGVVSLIGGGVGDAHAAEPPPALALGEPSATPSPHLAAGQAGVWGGQSLSIDLRQPTAGVGAMISVDLAERSLGSTWQSTVRPGVGLVARVRSTDLSVSGGYGVVSVHPQGAAWTVEHRVWQSFQADTRLGAGAAVRLTERARVEERFLPDAAAAQVRLRMLTRGLVPIGAHGWGLSAWDEVFVRLNRVGGAPGLDQNRVFLGPSYQSDGGVRAEVGYLQVLVDKRDDVAGVHELVANHVVLLQLTVSLRPRAAER